MQLSRSSNRRPARSSGRNTGTGRHEANIVSMTVIGAIIMMGFGFLAALKMSNQSDRDEVFKKIALVALCIVGLLVVAALARIGREFFPSSRSNQNYGSFFTSLSNTINTAVNEAVHSRQLTM